MDFSFKAENYESLTSRELLTKYLCYGKADQRGENEMETVDWQNVIAGGLAIVIFIGGLLMMFSNLWTSGIGKDK